MQLSTPISGTRLTGPAEANWICASTFGSGWKMAEFHDGYYFLRRPIPGLPLPQLRLRSGWNLWGHGTLPTNIRFWAHINDQAGNPWN